MSQWINNITIQLELIKNAIKRKNYNLVNILIEDYFKKIPQKEIDKILTKRILNAIKTKNNEILEAAIDAEIERIDLLRIKNLIQKIKKKSSHTKNT